MVLRFWRTWSNVYTYTHGWKREGYLSSIVLSRRQSMSKYFHDAHLVPIYSHSPKIESINKANSSRCRPTCLSNSPHPTRPAASSSSLSLSSSSHSQKGHSDEVILSGFTSHMVSNMQFEPHCSRYVVYADAPRARPARGTSALRGRICSAIAASVRSVRGRISRGGWNRCVRNTRRRCRCRVLDR